MVYHIFFYLYHIFFYLKHKLSVFFARHRLVILIMRGHCMVGIHRCLLSPVVSWGAYNINLTTRSDALLLNDRAINLHARYM